MKTMESSTKVFQETLRMKKWKGKGKGGKGKKKWRVREESSQ